MSEFTKAYNTYKEIIQTGNALNNLKNYDIDSVFKELLEIKSIIDDFEKNGYKDIKNFTKAVNKASIVFGGNYKVPETRKEALETKAHINSVKTGINDDIKDLIIKPVPNCPGYSFGKYSSFDVIFRDSDGFINASKLCKLSGKDYRAWIRYDSSQKLINALKRKLFSKFNQNKDNTTQNMMIGEFTYHRNSDTNTQNVTTFEDIIVEDNIGKNNISKIIQGTYVHPKLINSIAMWISEDFALEVSDIVEEYFVKKANNNLNNLIKEKDDKIDVLIKETRMQTQIIEKQSEELKEIKQLNLKQSEDLKTLLSYGKEARKSLIKIDSNLEDIHSKSIEPCKESIETDLVLLYNNTGDDYNIVKTINDKGVTSYLHPFSMLCCQKRSVNKTVKKHLSFKALALKKHILKQK